MKREREREIDGDRDRVREIDKYFYIETEIDRQR